MINTFEELVRNSRFNIKFIFLIKIIFYHLNRRLTGPSVFSELSNKLKQDYVNELTYKLTVFDNNDVGRLVCC